MCDNLLNKCIYWSEYKWDVILKVYFDFYVVVEKLENSIPCVVVIEYMVGL